MNSNTCNKLSRRTTFRDCMQEIFPPGSDFYELENFLMQQGFNKIVDEPKGDDFDFVFVWAYPISLKSNTIVVSGEYDEQLKIVRLRNP